MLVYPYLAKLVQNLIMISVIVMSLELLGRSGNKADLLNKYSKSSELEVPVKERCFDILQMNRFLPKSNSIRSFVKAKMSACV